MNWQANLYATVSAQFEALSKVSEVRVRSREQVAPHIRTGVGRGADRALGWRLFCSLDQDSNVSAVRGKPAA
jgi:hypothetical protein